MMPSHMRKISLASLPPKPAFSSFGVFLRICGVLKAAFSRFLGASGVFKLAFSRFVEISQEPLNRSKAFFLRSCPWTWPIGCKWL
jgi:hypothetical protein